MGSEEESGKDWSELEEEAARGEFNVVVDVRTCEICIRVSYANLSDGWL